MNETTPADNASDDNNVDGTVESTAESNVDADAQSNIDDVVPPRYPTWSRKRPERYFANAARRGNADDDGATLRVAMQSKEANGWKKVIDG